MGFGLPAAMGAQALDRKRLVVCIAGDGSLQMNIQEMATAAEEGANIKVILMNNQSLGMVHQQQDMFYKKRLYAVNYARRLDFVKIAEGFGMQAFDLDQASDPRALLAQALATEGPCLIHCSIDVNQKVFPMVPPGAANTEMIGD